MKNSVSGTWESWYSWSKCSSSCGIGLQTRRRQCDHTYSITNCTGSAKQTLICSGTNCKLKTTNSYFDRHKELFNDAGNAHKLSKAVDPSYTNAAQQQFSKLPIGQFPLPLDPFKVEHIALMIRHFSHPVAVLFHENLGTISPMQVNRIKQTAKVLKIQNKKRLMKGQIKLLRFMHDHPNLPANDFQHLRRLEETLEGLHNRIQDKYNRFLGPKKMKIKSDISHEAPFFLHPPGPAVKKIKKFSADRGKIVVRFRGLHIQCYKSKIMTK